MASAGMAIYYTQELVQTIMGKLASSYIRNNLSEVEKLPPPTEQWKFRDLEISQGTLHSLRQHELIEKVGSQRISGGSDITVWRTLPYTWQKIQQYQRERE
jgi:hypothetical protein